LTEALQRSARAFVDMLNDVLDLAKIEAGRMELETVDFRLSRVMGELREFFAPVMSQKGLAFEVRTLEASADAVRGDPRRLRQVLLNLVGNALKFTDAGSVTLSLRALRSGGVIQAEFEVADSGIGIGEEALHRLFQPFEQGDTSTSRRFGGTGLGLHICKQLVAEMGGEISVKSRKGQGSQFRFSVPLAHGEEQSIVDRPAALASDSAKILEGLTLSILVAEDNPTTQLLITQMMELWGHKVVLAHDGAEAVARAQAADFDVILMDMQMPVMDGLQATRRIREGTGPQAKIPIIAVTADAIAENHVGYYTAGVNAVFTKPIAWDVLARRIKALVAKESRQGAADEAVPPTALAVLDPAWINALKTGLNINAVKALLASCLDSMDRYPRELRRSIAAGDHAAARRAAHDLKGNCAQFGALQASDLARRIENEAHDAETLQRIARALETGIGEARIAIRQIAGTL
jgi:CheY-like chemotaxis protein/HPt (histidine-containing phosphotransfer) domain-containing protein